MRKVLILVFVATLYCSYSYAFETYIPHITSGYDDWADYLQVNNTSYANANFDLTLYNNGNEIRTYIGLYVEGLESIKRDLKLHCPDAEMGVITYTDPGLNFRMSYENTGGGLAEFKTIDDLNNTIGLYFSDVSSAIVSKGIAVANMGDSTAGVVLYAMGQKTVLDTYTTSIGPKDKILGVYNTWFPEVAFEDIDAILVATDSSSLCGIVISGDADLSHLLFTTGIPVPKTVVGPATDKAGAPFLISPETGYEMDNGCTDRTDNIVWNFDWSDAPAADEYRLYVKQEGALNPTIDEFITESEYSQVLSGSYISNQNAIKKWIWKVEALLSDYSLGWSEESYFYVEPTDTDCSD